MELEHDSVKIVVVDCIAFSAISAICIKIKLRAIDAVSN